MGAGTATVDSISSIMGIEKAKDGYLSIRTKQLALDSVVNFDLFHKVNNRYTLYRGRDLPFDEENRKNLIKYGVKFLYIKSEDERFFEEYVEKNIGNILDGDGIPPKVKAHIFYGVAKNIVSDMYTSELTVEKVTKAKNMTGDTLKYLLGDKAAFHNVMDSLSFDYTLHTHSINVFVFSVSLAKALDIWEDEQLHTLGMAALLHDVGKMKIDKSILEKNGPLTDAEMAEMRRHPTYSAEILKGMEGITPEMIAAVLEHHERDDGQGYPDGKSFSEISEPGRIIGVAEVFDALTTHKPYGQAIPTFDALKIMKTEMKGHFDDETLNKFIGLFRR